MKIGILVDGEAEYHGMRLLLPKIKSPAHFVPRPLRCDMQPFAPAAQIARVAMKSIPILIRRGADEIVILMDKECRSECTPGIARELERELSKRLSHEYPKAQVRVVLKVNCFENWLIADPRAYSSLKGMFHHKKRIQKAVVPNKADNVDAMRLLKACSHSGDFDKVKGAKAICNFLDPDSAAENSRSFRRFLRIVKHPKYSSQSRNP